MDEWYTRPQRLEGGRVVREEQTTKKIETKGRRTQLQSSDRWGKGLETRGKKRRLSSKRQEWHRLWQTIIYYGDLCRGTTFSYSFTLCPFLYA